MPISPVSSDVISSQERATTSESEGNPESSSENGSDPDSTAPSSDSMTVDEENISAADESLKAKLASWQVKHHISHAHCDDLLKILNEFHPDLPLFTRTLVGTPRKAISLRPVLPGKYAHIGIEKGILRSLKFAGEQDLLANPVCMYVGIDGIGLTNSSCSVFWVIVGYLPFLKDLKVAILKEFLEISFREVAGRFEYPSRSNDNQITVNCLQEGHKTHSNRRFCP